MHRQRGFSLLEAMIAGTLLAVALLALATLATRSLQTASVALDQRLATILLNDLRHRTVLIAREGTGSAPAGALAAEFTAWQDTVRRALPDSRSRLCRAGATLGTPGSCPTTPGWEGRLAWRRFPAGEGQQRSLAWSP